MTVQDDVAVLRDMLANYCAPNWTLERAALTRAIAAIEREGKLRELVDSYYASNVRNAGETLHKIKRLFAATPEG